MLWLRAPVGPDRTQDVPGCNYNSVVCRRQDLVAKSGWPSTVGVPGGPANGCCSANEQVRGCPPGCALDAPTSTNAFRPQGAVLPAENQDASHHPLNAPQLR